MKEKARKIDRESELHNEMNIEQMWDVFHSKVKHLEDEFVPKKTVKTGNIKNHSLKLDENTRNLIKKKHALSRKLVASHMNQKVRKEYNKIRNKVKSTIKKLKNTLKRNLSRKRNKTQRRYGDTYIQKARPGHK